MRSEVILWQDCRKQVHKLNPDFAELIDKLDPGKKLPLIKISSPFGTEIIKNGSINSLPKPQASKLNYASIPLFFIISKQHEVYVENNDRVIPLNLVEEGDLVGVFETVDSMFNLQSKPPWSVSAGARSILMLPKISDLSRYKRLASKYNIELARGAKKLSEHWNIFKLIAQTDQSDNAWQSQVLMFTSDWFDRKRNDSLEWQLFYGYVFKKSWETIRAILQKFNIEYSWEAFINAIESRRLKPSPYISNNLKHFMLIGSGLLPGMMFADFEETAAPISLIQNAFVDTYGLQDYLPCIMHVAPLNTIKQKKIVYYSLSFPTLLEGAPGSSYNKTIMMDLKEISLGLKTICERINESLVNELDIKFFHTEKCNDVNILSSNMIPSLDPRFNKALAKFPDRKFPDQSLFWRGCISISLAKN